MIIIIIIITIIIIIIIIIVYNMSNSGPRMVPYISKVFIKVMWIIFTLAG